MTTVQVSLKLDKELVERVEELVRKAPFRSKTEVFIQALKLLIRRYEAEEAYGGDKGGNGENAQRCRIHN